MKTINVIIILLTITINVFSDSHYCNPYSVKLDQLIRKYKTNNPKALIHIEIFKKNRVLSVYADQQLIRSYSCVFGVSFLEDKEKEGDHKTPSGYYYVTSKNALGVSHFHQFLGLSYPNSSDADRGVRDGLIDESLARRIKWAEKNRRWDVWPKELWYTKLGGKVGIHGVNFEKEGVNEPNGIQAYGDWTFGCICTSNRDVDDLFNAIRIGTPVAIRVDENDKLMDTQ